MMSFSDRPDKTMSPTPGDVVLTPVGVVVVTKVLSKAEQNEPLFFQGRIWRVPGKSIASSAYCCLRNDSIIKHLPAAPGMLTHANFLESDKNEYIEGNEELCGKHQVLVLCYSPNSDTYLVSPCNSDDTQSDSNSFPQIENGKIDGDHKKMGDDGNNFFKMSIRVKSDQVETAKCAKFYPLIEDLMQRGDQAASASSSIFSTSTINRLASKSSELIDVAAKSSKQSLSKENVEVVSDSIQTMLPDQEQVNQVYQMMKDEELTSLLKKGQERLRQLIHDDIPQATEVALNRSGIKIVEGSTGISSVSGIMASREKALVALNDLLSEHTNMNMEEIKTTLGKEFTTVFDSLSTAAKSDRYLNSIFDTITEKTSEWQEATGRVLSTRSASLFFEGTKRLQARAASLFSPEQMKAAKETGMRLSKAFTEGDAALARLKTIELGDAVRTRLIAAIEVRSGSQGGLDGIIANALTSINSRAMGEGAEQKAQFMLSNLQVTASNAAKNAHETLIATLSRKSEFRDMAMLRIEQTMIKLESALESDMSADEIAALARGDGGTAALFDPIARRATKEIEKQLDAAEAYMKDPTVLAVLSRVRKIISGDLSVSGLLDEVVSVLNDEKVVAYGEGLMKQGERMLDVLENASGNKMVGDMMLICENAGLTKEAVVGRIETLDVNMLLDTAETAVTDEAARKKMLSSAADSALEFLLRILPSMPVPPFDGVKDGLVYHLSNLSMEGFKVKKEDIIVEIAGIRAAKQEDLSTEESSPNDIDIAAKNQSISEFTKTSSVESIAGSSVKSSNLSIEDSEEGPEEVYTEKQVKATELLVIDVKNISAVFKDPVWSFEQTYFPYLKGNGTAFVQLSDGSIRLQFELRRRKSPESTPDCEKWEPILCLHERSCSIGELELRLDGEGRLTWIFNKLASYFRAALRNYVVRSIVQILGNRSGSLLKMLNDNLNSYWDVILRTAGLNMDDLTEVSEDDLIEAAPDPYANEVELVWREHLPLGMNLLMNDDSGLLKVVDFPRGSQARKVAEARSLDPTVFEGATITAVNGTRFDIDSQEELVEALKDPGRPKTVSFELSNPEDAERIRRFVEGMEGEKPITIQKIEPETGRKEKSMSVKKVSITEVGPLGIQFSSSVDEFSLIVEGFSKGDNGVALIAENNDNISFGDVLVSVNETCVLGENGTGRNRAVSLLEASASIRPLSLGFSEPYLNLVVLEKPTDGIVEINDPTEELIFEEKKLISGGTRVILKKFNNVAGLAEAGGVFLGDHLVFVNGIAVGAGCRFLQRGPFNQLEDVLSMLEDKNYFPLALTFARASQEMGRWGTFSMETATTFSISANSIEELGCEFGNGKEKGDIVVSNLCAVNGHFQKTLDTSKDWIGMAVESIDREVVPSYATGKIVTNALRRSWENSKRIEMVFCDDERRDWLKNLLAEQNEG